MTSPIGAADVLWRAQMYVAVAQIHLSDNVLLCRPLGPDDIKARPAGHWGTVPGTAWALTHTALLGAQGGGELVPLLGAGHAGVVQIATGWLTGHLAAVRPQFSRDEQGLLSLCRAFPDVDGLGSEVTPALPAGDFLGGRLGGCLPFAQGAALADPGRVIVPVLGDGECETPTTAAAWLASHALPGTPVLPIVHLNGFRMGAPSTLSRFDDQALDGYAAGLGWHARIVHVPADGHRAFRTELAQAVADTLAGRRTVMFMRCVKGFTGPATAAGQPVLGTARAHKTPLTHAATDATQREALERWLSSYRPGELFTRDGRPGPDLAAALTATAWPRLPVQPGLHDSLPAGHWAAGSRPRSPTPSSPWSATTPAPGTSGCSARTNSPRTALPSWQRNRGRPRSSRRKSSASNWPATPRPEAGAC